MKHIIMALAASLLSFGPMSLQAESCKCASGKTECSCKKECKCKSGECECHKTGKCDCDCESCQKM